MGHVNAMYPVQFSFQPQHKSEILLKAKTEFQIFIGSNEYLAAICTNNGKFLELLQIFRLHRASSLKAVRTTWCLF
jgi:hypothetical protein